MKNVSILRAARPRHGLISGAMVCLLLSGCMGQKNSLPSFSWKQSADSVEKKESTEQATPVASENDMMHVALNDPAAIGAETTLGESDILQASADAGNASEQATLANNEEIDWDELDAAFQSAGKPQPTETTPENAPNLDEFETVIASVDQGDSHLDALKKSLNDINRRESSEEAGTVYLGDVHSENWVSPTQEPLPELIDFSDEEVAASSQPESAAPFPGSRIPSEAVLSEEGPLEKARLLITRSRTLIQENNLRAAANVAQSAQTMLQKTQSALLPGEVTPEQVLADIAARQAAYEQRLNEQVQQVASQAKPAETSQQPVPVVIDMSREWINPGKPTQKAKVDDLQAFAQATVQANRPASLPVINPGPDFVPNSDPLRISEAESDVLQAPPSGETLAEPSDISDVVLLGDVPADDAAAPFVLSGDSQRDDTAPTFEHSSAPPLTLGEANSGPSLGGSSAPLLMAPGGSSVDFGTDAADLDEFAADFANVTQEAPPKLDEAPLLIDETELHDEPKKAKGMSRTNMLLIAGGIVAGLLLFSRWKR